MFCARGLATTHPLDQGRRSCRVICFSQSRRQLLLNSSSVGLMAVLGLPLPPGPRPSNLGLADYGGGNKQLSLCSRPKTSTRLSPDIRWKFNMPPSRISLTCVGISTSEAANNDTNYVPPWTYNPTIGRGKKRSLSSEEAMAQLKQVVTSLQPDGYKPTIIKETPEYLYVEYRSPALGFIDDVEFYVNANKSEVEYRSSSRWGVRDFDVNRKRIRALRKELEMAGWLSAGY